VGLVLSVLGWLASLRMRRALATARQARRGVPDITDEP
jgi:hypothetical protein